MRRALFVVVSVLLLVEPAQRFLCSSLLNLLSLMLHLYVRPFSDATFNAAETVSYLLLTILSMLCNPFASASPMWLQVLLFLLVIPPSILFVVLIAWGRVLFTVRKRGLGMRMKSQARLSRMETKSKLTSGGAPASQHHPTLSSHHHDNQQLTQNPALASIHDVELSVRGEGMGWNKINHAHHQHNNGVSSSMDGSILTGNDQANVTASDSEVTL